MGFKQLMPDICFEYLSIYIFHFYQLAVLDELEGIELALAKNREKQV